MTDSDYKKLIEYWLEGSRYDWDTFLSLKKSKRYGPALFFLHLSLEKKLKSVIVKKEKQHAPFSHNLVLLAGRTGIDVPKRVEKSLEEITKFNVESRYPDERFEFYMNTTLKVVEVWQAEVEKIKKWIDQAETKQ